MIQCTCGKLFKTTSVGDVVVSNGYLYSCDTKECVGCGKRIIDRASSPICSLSETERVDRIIDSMDAHGKQVYGKPEVKHSADTLQPRFADVYNKNNRLD